jgi:hypothetical protein
MRACRQEGSSSRSKRASMTRPSCGTTKVGTDDGNSVVRSRTSTTEGSFLMCRPCVIHERGSTFLPLSPGGASCRCLGPHVVDVARLSSKRPAIRSSVGSAAFSFDRRHRPCCPRRKRATTHTRHTRVLHPCDAVVVSDMGRSFPTNDDHRWPSSRAATSMIFPESTISKPSPSCSSAIAPSWPTSKPSGQCTSLILSRNVDGSPTSFA